MERGLLGDVKGGLLEMEVNGPLAASCSPPSPRASPRASLRTSSGISPADAKSTRRGELSVEVGGRVSRAVGPCDVWGESAATSADLGRTLPTRVEPAVCPARSAVDEPDAVVSVGVGAVLRASPEGDGRAAWVVSASLLSCASRVLMAARSEAFSSAQ